jgi:hypothetical protein
MRKGDDMPKREGFLPIPLLTFVFNGYHSATESDDSFVVPQRRKRRSQKCSECHKPGHRRPKCPELLARAEAVLP